MRQKLYSATAANNTELSLSLVHNLGLQYHVGLSGIPTLIIPQPCVSEALIWVGVAERSKTAFSHLATTCKADAVL